MGRAEQQACPIGSKCARAHIHRCLHVQRCAPGQRGLVRDAAVESQPVTKASPQPGMIQHLGLHGVQHSQANLHHVGQNRGDVTV